MAALTPDHLPVLVTAPKRVAEHVWATEVRKWRPDLTCAVAKGSKAARARELRSGKDIIVLGRDNLADALAVEGHFRTLVIDELSGFKSRASVRWKTARQLLRDPELKHVWGLTGTPAPNGLMDLWAQVALLDGGVRLGKTLTAFRSRYFTPGRQLPSGTIIEWNLRTGADTAIHKAIDDICLSMDTEGRVELPPVTYNRVEVPLEPKVRKVYKDMKKDLVADLDMLGGAVHTAANAAILSNKLSQITAGFLFEDRELAEAAGRKTPLHTVLHQNKLRALEEIIEGTGSPVLVFYTFVPEREAILKALPGAKTLDDPHAVEDWNAGRIPVLVAHPRSAGHGLNLQFGGHTVVWTSGTYSMEDWEQGNKRVARSGQEHPVVIHSLVSPNTVDEVMLAVVGEKKTIQDALLDHLESPL